MSWRSDVKGARWSIVLALVVGFMVLATGAARADQKAGAKKKKARKAPLALVLLVDRSGSMSGPKIEAAAKASKVLVGALPAKSLFGFIAFDTQPTTLVKLQAASDRKAIDAEIDRLNAGGGTNIYPALVEAQTVLAKANARTRHVILLSDGQSSYDGIKDLAEKMAKAGITISAIGIGDADRNLLTIISKGGKGKLYDIDDPEQLSRVFADELARIQGGK